LKSEKKIAILGAGPAGLGLAMKLLRRQDLNASVTVFDYKPYVGGIAASFKEEDIYFDHGSHRLHPATSAEILDDIKGLLQSDLLDRPRNGRISLLGRFVKFPLNPLDLALHLPPSFMAGFTLDLLTKPFRPSKKPQETFADVLMDGLGKTMCHEFYFPYAKKLWGLDPEKISVIQAQRRVSANSISKIIAKAFSLLPGIKKEGKGRFFYPRKGFGQISIAMAEEVQKLGGQLRLSTLVTSIDLSTTGQKTLTITPAVPTDDGAKPKTGEQPEEQIYDFVFSTIPLTVLAK